MSTHADLQPRPGTTVHLEPSPDGPAAADQPFGHQSVTDLDCPGPYGPHSAASPLGARFDHPSAASDDAAEDDTEDEAE